jgi:hypothetical protein
VPKRQRATRTAALAIEENLPENGLRHMYRNS